MRSESILEPTTHVNARTVKAGADDTSISNSARKAARSPRGRGLITWVATSHLALEYWGHTTECRVSVRLMVSFVSVQTVPRDYAFVWRTAFLRRSSFLEVEDGIWRRRTRAVTSPKPLGQQRLKFAERIDCDHADECCST